MSKKDVIRLSDLPAAARAKVLALTGEETSTSSMDEAPRRRPRPRAKSMVLQDDLERLRPRIRGSRDLSPRDLEEVVSLVHQGATSGFVGADAASWWLVDLADAEPDESWWNDVATATTGAPGVDRRTMRFRSERSVSREELLVIVTLAGQGVAQGTLEDGATWERVADEEAAR